MTAPSPPDRPSDSAPDLGEVESRRLMEEHSPLVRQIAASMARDLPDSVQMNDMVQDGMLGLMDAILRANKAMTAQQFRSYAATRIRGAVLDGLRALDWGTRRVRRVMREVEICTQQLCHALGRAPNETEVAHAMGIPLTQYQHTLQEAQGYTLISLEDLNDGEGQEGTDYLDQCVSTQTDPLAVLERAAFRQLLARSLMDLPAQEKVVVSQYYEGGLTLKQIGEGLQLSEARISQIHAQAIVRLRAAVLGGEPRSRVLAPRRKPR